MIAVLLLIGSMALLLYTYIGYPVLLRIRVGLHPRRVRKEPFFPLVSVIIAVHNESRCIERKLQSIFSVNWPSEKLEVIVISDGSTDSTNDILARYANSQPHLNPIFRIDRHGKAAALNVGMRRARGQVVVFTDARQLLEPRSLQEMVANFADETVGCVSGNLIIGRLTDKRGVSGEELKWALENKIREWEGETTSVVGALGAFYGARREHLVQIPEGTLLDDCYLPLTIVRSGYRTVFEKNARAWDDVDTTPAQEFRRKVRTLTGNYQLLRLAPWLLGPCNPVRFEFFSHKICRLLTPFAVMLLLVSSWFARGPWFRSFALAQSVTYLIGLIAIARPSSFLTSFRPIEVVRAFLVLNAATLVAFYNFALGKYEVWTRDAVSASP